MASYRKTILSLLPKRLQTPMVFQVVIFTITFMLYAAVHAVRKTIGTIQKPLKAIGYTPAFFSYLSSAFMLSYSLGMMWTGVLGDKYKPTGVLLIAGTGSAIVTVIVGVMIPELITTSYWPLYTFLWTVNGLFQSCVWPVEVKLVSRWFAEDHSGSLFGIWSANSSVGNILGIGFTAMAVNIWGAGSTGISLTFIIPSVFLVVVTVFTYFLPNNKREAGVLADNTLAVNNVGHRTELSTENGVELTSVETQSNAGGFPSTTSSQCSEKVMSSEKDKSQSPKTSNALSCDKMVALFSAWLLPGVIRYSLCYACIKSVNYTIFYWLTDFLEQMGHSRNDAYVMTILNDVGWIFGGLACGYGTDRMKLRAPVVGLFILLSIPPTIFIYPCISSIGVTSTLILLNGFFAGGAGNVVASAVCADIGRNEKVKGSSDITSQIAGIIDGVGAFGAAITQLIVGHLSGVDLGVVFYSLSGMLAVALLLIGDLVYRETMLWFRLRRESKMIATQKEVVPQDGIMVNYD